MIEYTVVLAAAGLHAVWNAILKSGGDRTSSLIVIRSTGIIAGIVFVSLNPVVHSEALPWLGAAVCIHLVYYFFLLQAYGAGDFSQVYPIARGTAPLLVTLGAMLFAGENLSAAVQLGVLFIGLGVVFLTVSGPVRLSGHAVGYSLATAICIAGYTFCGGSGIRKAGNIWAFIGLLEIFTGVVMLCFGLLLRRKQLADHLGRRAFISVLAGLLSVAGYAAALWAMTKAPLGPVAALRETGIVFAALIGAVFLREGHLYKRLAASGVVIAGIFLIVTAR